MRLGFELVTASVLRRMVVDEYGGEQAVPDRAFAPAVTSILARLATSHHLVVCGAGAEALVNGFPAVLRVAVTAPERFRVGTLMIEHSLEKAAAQALLKQIEREQLAGRKRQFGRARAAADEFDLALNAATFDADQMAHWIAEVAVSRGLAERGLLTSSQEAAIAFEARLKLARHRIAPAGRAELTKKPFVNAAEQIFANLLDFYRIAWEYEPKSFPIQWGRDGKVLESFTPDFFLPDLDQYIELTTMKQANVTRKNRKVKLLRTIYPHINIQVFYQRDFQQLVFKYGLGEKAMPA
jgi:hypothetical protein